MVKKWNCHLHFLWKQEMHTSEKTEEAERVTVRIPHSPGAPVQPALADRAKCS